MRQYAIMVAAMLSAAGSAAAQTQAAPVDEAQRLARRAAAAALDTALPKLEAVCYGRFYDAAHLKARPKQAVTSVRFLRDFPTIRLERGMESERETKEGRRAYGNVIVTYRDSGARRFTGGANCMIGAAGEIYCGSDSCDGGGFRMRIEGTDTLWLGSKEPGGRFTVSGGCGGGPDRNLNRGEDDNLFRLTKMSVKQCR
jgi:hypothetical protein